MSILVVDDNPALLRLYDRVAKADGHDIEKYATTAQALAALDGRKFDLVILDMQSPTNGCDLCRRMRETGDETPVLALTALTSERAQLQALESGVDDYLIKPCSYELLAARIRALLRRASYKPLRAWGSTHHRRLGKFNLGKWQIDQDTHMAVLPGEKVKVQLTPLEMRLIVLLSEHSGSIVSREEVLAVCWRGEPDVSDNALAAVAARLRRKLQGSGVAIKAMRKRGLKLQVDQDEPTKQSA